MACLFTTTSELSFSSIFSVCKHTSIGHLAAYISTAYTFGLLGDRGSLCFCMHRMPLPPEEYHEVTGFVRADGGDGHCRVVGQGRKRGTVSTQQAHVALCETRALHLYPNH